MDPLTHKCVVSREVVFDEISSYYGHNEVPLKHGDSDFSKYEVTSLPFRVLLIQNRCKLIEGVLTIRMIIKRPVLKYWLTSDRGQQLTAG